MGIFDFLRRSKSVEIDTLKELSSIFETKEKRKSGSDNWLKSYREFREFETEVARENEQRTQQILEDYHPEESEDQGGSVEDQLMLNLMSKFFNGNQSPQSENSPVVEVNPTTTTGEDSTMSDEQAQQFAEVVNNKCPKRFKGYLEHIKNLSDADLAKIKKNL